MNNNGFPGVPSSRVQPIHIQPFDVSDQESVENDAIEVCDDEAQDLTKQPQESHIGKNIDSRYFTNIHKSSLFYSAYELDQLDEDPGTDPETDDELEEETEIFEQDLLG